MDYRRPLHFGYFPSPEAAQHRALLDQARLCEELGLDLIGIQDHPYQRRFLDTWTLLGVIAGQTRRIRLFTDVASLPLRPSVPLGTDTRRVLRERLAMDDTDMDKLEREGVI